MIELVKAETKHFNQWHETFNKICAEQKYMEVTTGWAPEVALNWCMAHLVLKNPLYMLIDEKEGKVVGWVEITRKIDPSTTHRGELSLGMLPEYRGAGHGKKMMNHIMNVAKNNGFTKLELRVRNDNVAAVEMYLKFGFEFEGCIKNAVILNGATINMLEMGRTL